MRLTVLYVIVLACVCLLFTSFIYALASNEIEQTSRRQVVGFRGALGRFIINEAESEKLRKIEADEARSRLGSKLILGNLAVVGIGALLSYRFAKKTLEPVEESLRAHERFTSDASHELRTPLASMRTEIEVALRDIKLSSKESRQLLESNLEEVLTLQHMTDNLLSLARNREIGDKRQVDVDKVITKLVRKYQPIAKKNRMKITVDLEKIKLHTNPNALSQLVAILVDNSLKYAGSDTVIQITSTKQEDYAQICVSDNGVGIPPGEIENIFDRFYKADLSRTDSRSKGHGLGLSIAKQLSDALGGTIVAQIPQNGKGIAFNIRIPLL
jgi:signal transduction histidine kinase